MTILIDLFIQLVGGLIVIVVHELPKSVTAHFLMHPLYRNSEKINKNILKYVDPIGLLMFMFLGVGWQKPYEYNSSRYKDKSKGILSVAITGYISNLIFMILLIPLYYIISNGYVHYFIFVLIYYNFSIILINLLPVPPLEMSKVIHSFSPNTYFKLVQNERMIHTAFILMLALRIISKITSSSYFAFGLPSF